MARNRLLRHSPAPLPIYASGPARRKAHMKDGEAQSKDGRFELRPTISRRQDWDVPPINLQSNCEREKSIDNPIPSTYRAESAINVARIAKSFWPLGGPDGCVRRVVGACPTRGEIITWRLGEIQASCRGTLPLNFAVALLGGRSLVMGALWQRFKKVLTADCTQRPLGLCGPRACVSNLQLATTPS